MTNNGNLSNNNAITSLCLRSANSHNSPSTVRHGQTVPTVTSLSLTLKILRKNNSNIIWTNFTLHKLS